MSARDDYPASASLASAAESVDRSPMPEAVQMLYEIDRLRWEANHYRERCAYLGERLDALNAVIPCCPGNFYPGGDQDHSSWCHTLKDQQ